MSIATLSKRVALPDLHLPDAHKNKLMVAKQRASLAFCTCVRPLAASQLVVTGCVEDRWPRPVHVVTIAEEDLSAASHFPRSSLSPGSVAQALLRIEISRHQHLVPGRC